VLGELETRHVVESGGKAPRLFATTFDQFVRTEASASGSRPSLLGRWFGTKN